MGETEKFNPDIINLWENPAPPEFSGTVEIINLFKTEHKVQLDDNEDTHKSKPETPA